MSGVLSYGALWRAKIEGSAVRPLNPIQFYRLGGIARLRDLTPGDRPKNQRLIAQAEVFLSPFFQDALYKEIAPAASERAATLLATAKQYVDPHGDFWEEGTPDIERDLLQFETSFEDDLSRLPTYIVERIAAYSSADLIASADNVFSVKIKPDYALVSA